jgi:hypothetical protein
MTVSDVEQRVLISLPVIGFPLWVGMKLLFGDEAVSFVDGHVEVAVPAGQSELNFSQLSQGDVDTDQQFTLSASVLKADGRVLAEKRARIERNQAQWLSYVGKRRGEAWAQGMHRGEYALFHGAERARVFAVVREARLDLGASGRQRQ